MIHRDTSIISYLLLVITASLFSRYSILATRYSPAPHHVHLLKARAHGPREIRSEHSSIAEISSAKAVVERDRRPGCDWLIPYRREPAGAGVAPGSARGIRDRDLERDRGGGDGARQSIARDK